IGRHDFDEHLGVGVFGAATVSTLALLPELQHALERLLLAFGFDFDSTGQSRPSTLLAKMLQREIVAERQQLPWLAGEPAQQPEPLVVGRVRNHRMTTG